MESESIAWLIEMPGPGLPHYYCATSFEWTSDLSRAVRFLRREDADRVRISLPDGHLARSVEHMWIGSTAKPGAPPVTRPTEPAAPWWDELYEYPSPLDVKRLREDATGLLVAARQAQDLVREVAASMVCPKDNLWSRALSALDAAIAKAEGREP